MSRKRLLGAGSDPRDGRRRFAARLAAWTLVQAVVAIVRDHWHCVS